MHIYHRNVLLWWILLEEEEEEDEEKENETQWKRNEKQNVKSCLCIIFIEIVDDPLSSNQFRPWTE